MTLGWLIALLMGVLQWPAFPGPGPVRHASGPPPPLCVEMQNGAYFPSGYSLFDNVVGRSTNSSFYLRFRPSKSGQVTSIRWYNSAGSHAVWDACTANYGAIEPCANHGGAPQFIHTTDPSYPKVFPNGWWPYANTCSTNYSGCYSGGTGGVVLFTLMNGSQTTLATATVNQPNVTYGFFSNFPVINLSTTVTLSSSTYYYIKVTDPDASPSANWWSMDNYTPYNLFTATQANALNLATVTAGGKAGVADAIDQSTFGGSTQTNFQPIFALGFTDGTCITQGFAP